MVIGWGLPYFQTFTPTLMTKLPVDHEYSKKTGSTQYAVLKAQAFPSDPGNLLLEENHVMFKMRSDSPTILKTVQAQLFDDPNSAAYIGSLRHHEQTDRLPRPGLRALGTMSIAKQMAVAAGVPGAEGIPDKAQLMMGFTSTQTAALGPDNIPSFETLPGVTDQWPSGYFAAGCAMHLSHLKHDLLAWYGSGYDDRVKRMFSPTTAVPAADDTVTLPNGPAEVAANNVKVEAASGLIGHNSALQPATRLGADITGSCPTGPTCVSSTGWTRRTSASTRRQWPRSGRTISCHLARTVRSRSSSCSRVDGPRPSGRGAGASSGVRRGRGPALRAAQSAPRASGARLPRGGRHAAAEEQHAGDDEQDQHDE